MPSSSHSHDRLHHRGQLASLFVIKPSPSVFGPCNSPAPKSGPPARRPRRRGYTFAEADRDDWHLETKWFGYGSGFFFGNKRYRITVDLVDGDSDGETFIEMVAEYERNSARDRSPPMKPGNRSAPIATSRNVRP